MAEYVEKTRLLERLTDYYNCAAMDYTKQLSVCTAADCLSIVEESPAADVVEVVRCKNCKHFCPYEGEEHKGDCAELVGLESCVYEDDFCSYGERKDGDEE